MKALSRISYWMIITVLLTSCGGGGGGAAPVEDDATVDNGTTPVVGDAPLEQAPDAIVSDLAPPTLSISGPTTESSFTMSSSLVDINGIASDDLSIIDITWSNNRGGTGSVPISENWFANDVKLLPGNNVISVTVTDGVGNKATDSITVTYNVSDTVSPFIAITSPTTLTSTTTTINRMSISGTSSDNISLKEIRWSLGSESGTAIGTDPWVVNGLPLTVGSNLITVTAYDSANNSATDTLNVVFEIEAADSCMKCHNLSDKNDYAGNGLANPHPFSGAQIIRCTTCHGGNGAEEDEDKSHVPPPPQIGDDDNLIDDPVAYFNRLTLTGIDKFPDYNVDGVNYTALEYLQFINPGDLRVVSTGKSCGGCHGDRHVAWMTKSPLATETGMLGGGLSAVGIENEIPEHRGKYNNTASDMAFRAVTNPDFDPNLFNNNLKVGAVGKLIEFPVMSQFGVEGEFNLFNNNDYDANNLTDDLFTINEFNGQKTNGIKAGSKLADLYREQVAFTCGDCHLGSAGANNRFGDFRSSGCTACHMPYSSDGRSQSNDPNINKDEPNDPDAIAAPERAHIATHVIKNVAKTLPNGQSVQGIGDLACAGCHQGSNRTVMQYWGIRLDQNQDLTNNTQYPANPDDFDNTADDERLFDPDVNNNTFNGRIDDQYIAFEDYDGDNRDDTPADVHHAAGLGCIDCHGSRDLHGGAQGDQTGNEIFSRAEQVTVIRCESCHGSVDGYAKTEACLSYEDTKEECAVDGAGNPLRHVTRDAATGNFMLKSRLDGRLHYISQTRDTIVKSNKTNPFTNEAVYSAKASYAMGRADGDSATGTGPLQNDPNKVANGFSHSDNMSCVSCHAAWTNSCIGCHLAGEYDGDEDNFRFSNITGERIVYNEQNADFVYQTPVPFQLGVTPDNKIDQMTPATKTFYRYTDINGQESPVMAFSDRNGNGNNPGVDGRNPFPSLGHNTMMAHSVRGKVQSNNEGPRYCVACHLNTESMENFGSEYNEFRTAMANNDFDNLDFSLLKEHIGENTGNQMNSPLWVHMVAGLGSGLFLFDENGCPVNPLDNNANRQYCNGNAPADNFDANNVVYNLDRIVEDNGISNAANNHASRDTSQTKRDGALNEDLPGTLGSQLIQKLTDPVNGIVLDSWLDADGEMGGEAAQFVE